MGDLRIDIWSHILTCNLLNMKQEGYPPDHDIQFTQMLENIIWYYSFLIMHGRGTELFVFKYFVCTLPQKFDEVLQKAKEDSGKTIENEEPSRISCFNCLGSHNLRDCPLPRDPLAISRNRRQFSARFGQAPNKTR